MSSAAQIPDDARLTRGRGRPRSVAADEAILEATRNVLAEDGWAALTVEGVAARAGVAKTTVYRRFSSRADLAVAAVAQLVSVARTAPGSSAAEDIRSAILACADIYGRPAARAAYLAVIAEAGRDPALRAAVVSQVLLPAREIVSDGLARAVERGDTTADLAVARTDLLYDLLAGTLVHRLLIREDEIDDDFIDTLTHAVLGALALPPMRGPHAP
jgi:AcrR family transcriptional regulator